MSKRASAPGSLFLKTGVSTNVFGEALATRQENEVPAMGEDFLSCPDKLRCRWSLFAKMLVWATIFAQTMDTKRESEVQSMG